MKAARVKLNDAQGGKSQDGSPLKGRIFKCEITRIMDLLFIALTQQKYTETNLMNVTTLPYFRH